MNNEERIKLFNDFHSGVRMFMDKIEKISREKQTWTLNELGEVADIMKDLAKTEKNIAKTHMIYSTHSEEVY